MLRVRTKAAHDLQSVLAQHLNVLTRTLKALTRHLQKRGFLFLAQYQWLASTLDDITLTAKLRHVRHLTTVDNQQRVAGIGDSTRYLRELVINVNANINYVTKRARPIHELGLFQIPTPHRRHNP